MKDGFDLESPLVCEGIIGDGCGGGRIFFLEEAILYAYDPQSQTKILLLDELSGIEKISKKACIITLQRKNDTIEFDLSSL